MKGCNNARVIYIFAQTKSNFYYLNVKREKKIQNIKN